MRRIIPAVLFLIIGVDYLAWGQDTPEAVEPTLIEEKEPARSMIAASGWCVVRSGSPDTDTTESEDNGADDGEDDDSEAASEDLPGFRGCDIGVGLSLYRLRRLSWVVVLGSKSLGTGLAWIVSRPAPDIPGPVIAIAIGIVARYDSGGVYIGEVYPAVGATLSFGRAGASP